jgi:Zn-finger nucleic acid-binding protein
MKCPVCAEPDLVMSERQGIEIDYCPKCRGVWLDRGELDKILDRSARPVPAELQPQPREERYAGEHRGQRRKRGGFLGEIFDFD